LPKDCARRGSQSEGLLLGFREVSTLGEKQSFKEQLVGTWTLLSWEQKRGDGTKVERYGTPKGFAFLENAKG
jgi:hypothetical protein